MSTTLKFVRRYAKRPTKKICEYSLAKIEVGDRVVDWAVADGRDFYHGTCLAVVHDIMDSQSRFDGQSSNYPDYWEDLNEWLYSTDLSKEEADACFMSALGWVRESRKRTEKKDAV